MSTPAIVGLVLAIIAGLIIVVAVAGAVFFVQVSEAGPDCSGGNEHSGGFYTMCGPAGWEETSFAPADVVYLTPDDGDGFRENVNIYSERVPPGTTAQEYYEASMEMLPLMITDYEPVDEGTRSVDGVAGHWIEYEGRQGAFTLRFWQFLTIHDGHGIVFTYTAQPEDQAQHRPPAMVALDSLRFQ